MEIKHGEKFKIITSGRLYYVSIIFSVILLSFFSSLINLFILIPIILILGIVGIGIAYLFTQNHYIEFEDNEIHAQIGLLNTKNLYAPYANIDHVEIKSDLVMKIFQLCELRIDTTGRGDTEIVMANIPLSKAMKAVQIVKSERKYEKKKNERA
jgi:uncharacterized membrane protein YdbT with pleckstrin-like domain